MVIINNVKCNGCKICTAICHEHCMDIENNLITIRYDQCRNLVGNQGILNKNKSFRKRLGLKKSERIRGMMHIGYPKFKFKNKVQGKKMSIQWNGIQN